MGLFRKAGDKAANDSFNDATQVQSVRVAADGRGKLFTSAVQINPAIFMPKDSIILVLRSFSVSSRHTHNAQGGEQCCRVAVLN